MVGERDTHISTKLTQRLIEVIHLREDTDNHHNSEDVGGGVAELVAPAEGEFESDAEALDGHDGDAAHRAADGDVDHGVEFAVARGDAVDHDDGEDGDDGAVGEEACVPSDLVSECIPLAPAYHWCRISPASYTTNA